METNHENSSFLEIRGDQHQPQPHYTHMQAYSTGHLIRNSEHVPPYFYMQQQHLSHQTNNHESKFQMNTMGGSSPSHDEIIAIHYHPFYYLLSNEQQHMLHYNGKNHPSNGHESSATNTSHTDTSQARMLISPNMKHGYNIDASMMHSSDVGEQNCYTANLYEEDINILREGVRRYLNDPSQESVVIIQYPCIAQKSYGNEKR
jgi:hypothetical protein